MKRSTLIILKVVTWVLCLLPVTMLSYEAVTNSLGPDGTSYLSLTRGSDTLVLLLLTLAITPLRMLFPRLSWLIKFRRLLGLFTFFYASLHLAVYVGLYMGFDWSVFKTDITKRRFIIAGFTAWALLLPLALTSTNWAIRKMGGKNWNRLHKLVYVAAVCGIIHYWWQVKPGVLTPMKQTIILFVLLAARPLFALIKRRKARPVMTA
jgi:sulfoxide reductase heme-binding subunit YedZ